MSLFQRLFGRDDKFYRLLKISAAEAQIGAAALARLAVQAGIGGAEPILGEIDQSRRKHKRLAREIATELFKTFSTPIEREDIESLSDSLYKISKSIEKIGERLLIRPPNINIDRVRRQLSLLEQGTSLVAQMVADLPTKSHSEAISDSYERIQAIEGDADRIMTEMLRELYQSDEDARTVVFWKDIYELVEKAIDRCRNAGGLIFEIVLKNS